MLQAPSRRRLSWVLATLIVTALPGIHSASAAVSPAATQALSSELPSGVTLSKASFKQTTSALHDAVAKNPKMAAKLVEAAVKAKSGKVVLECAQVRALARSAMAAAPGEARSISEMIAAIRPDCADGLNNDVAPARGNGILGEVGQAATEEAEGFGAGLGAGFPGSPGFIGSAPSGSFAGFTPVTTPAVTSTVNQ